MSSGAIADKQIKASAFDGEYAASKARLNATSAWCVTSLNATRSFLEVDLGRVMRVTGIDIWRFTEGYVTNFTIEYKRTRDQRWISMIERLPFNTSFFPVRWRGPLRVCRIKRLYQKVLKLQLQYEDCCHSMPVALVLIVNIFMHI